MTDERNAKAWPRVFADGHGLFAALVAIVEAVDAARARGAAISASCTRRRSTRRQSRSIDRALAEAARAWRAAADAWDELADSAVPSDLDGADDAVEGAEAVRSAVNDGEAGRARVRAAAAATWGIRARYAESFPLPAGRIDEILGGLGDQLDEIHQMEVDAVEATARAIGR